MFSTVARALPPIVGTATRTSPIVIQRIMAMRQSTPNIQKRDFSLIGTLIHTAIDATIITAGMSVMRRTIGVDMRNYAQMIQNPELRRVAFNYIDFGDRCVDKVIMWAKQRSTYYNSPYQSNNGGYQERQGNTDRNRYY